MVFHHPRGDWQSQTAAGATARLAEPAYRLNVSVCRNADTIICDRQDRGLLGDRQMHSYRCDLWAAVDDGVGQQVQNRLVQHRGVTPNGDVAGGQLKTQINRLIRVLRLKSCGDFLHQGF